MWTSTVLWQAVINPVIANCHLHISNVANYNSIMICIIMCYNIPVSLQSVAGVAVETIPVVGKSTIINE